LPVTEKNEAKASVFISVIRGKKFAERSEAKNTICGLSAAKAFMFIENTNQWFK